MHVAVVGAGAVGAYFGGRLAQAGEHVAFLARGEHLRAFRACGLRFESVDGDISLNAVDATDDAATVGPVDLVLLSVKGWQLPSAIDAMRPLVGAGTVVVPLLNGVDASDQVAAAFGAEHVAGGLCHLLGAAIGPATFRNMMPRPSITVGPLEPSQRERLEQLVQAFTRVGVRAEVADDIRAALWRKLLFVSPFGAVGAVTRVPVGVFRSLPETRALLIGAMREIVAVAHARGVALPEDVVTQVLAQVDDTPAQGTSSMQRDLMAGRPSELESQVGAVVRLAATAGVEAPRYAALYASLLPQERLARGEIELPR